MQVLRINLLGPFEARLDDGISLAFESLKSRALLVYLAVESGRSHSRETLAGMLWPERPDTAALANLRHTLASLRATLGDRFRAHEAATLPLFSTTANTIQFNLSKNVWMDLNEYERHLAVADTKQAEELQARIARLSAAVALYHGRFMEGFPLKGCPEFEDWMLLRREQLALKQQKALRSLADAHETSGMLEPALSALRLLLQLEPWDEAAHRKVMALLAVQDQRSAALSQFERCRKLLHVELGVAPEAETVLLYEQIRAGIFPGAGMKASRQAAAEEKPSLPIATARDLPRQRFVARSHELARLHAALKLALNQHGHLVFISGEAGSGKTSLLWEFAHQAMAQHGDLLVAAGRCDAITGVEDPFLPFREILQMLVGGNETRPGGRLTPDHLRRLTSAFPETIKSILASEADLIGSFIPREFLLQRIETFGPGGQAWQRKLMQIIDSASKGSASISFNPLSAADAQVRRPNEAFTRLLTDLAHHRPLLLIIDDLQWVDAGSVGLLHYLGKRLSGTRILVLGAYRPQDIVLGQRGFSTGWERHPLEPVRLELEREFGDIQVDLDQSEGKAFIDAFIDSEPNQLGESFRQTLYHHTDGNPLFTVELLRSMQEHGQIVQDAAGRWQEGKQYEWDKLPARVEAVIAERTGRLPPLQQVLLRAASVEGETFTAGVLARVLEMDEQQVLSWLSGPLSREQKIVTALSLTRPSPIRAESHAPSSRFRFSHFLFQKYLYGLLDPVERPALHEKTAVALEFLFGPTAAGMALQLAWHFEQAGLPARAVEYLLLAGRQAINLSAHRQAMALYDRCLGLIRQLADSPERSRLEIQVQLARGAPLFATDGWGSPQAMQAVNRAVELLQQSAENSADPSVLLALYLQADLFTAQNDMAKALASVDVLLERISPQTERVYQLLAYLSAGQAYMFSGQLVAAEGYLEKALSLYQAGDQPFLTGITGHNVRWACLGWTCVVQWLLGHADRAENLRQQLIAEARHEPTRLVAETVIAIAGAGLSALQNDPVQAGIYARECLSFPALATTSIARIFSEMILGWVHARQGDHEDSITLIKQAIEDWKNTGALTLLPFGMMLLADALSLSGLTDEALEIITSVRELIERSGRRAFASHLEWLQGEVFTREQIRRPPNLDTAASPAMYYERAVEIAQTQQALALELRATTSLARYLQERGQTGEAARRLKAILRRFDQQVETHDLREARELIAVIDKAFDYRI